MRSTGRAIGLMTASDDSVGLSSRPRPRTMPSTLATPPQCARDLTRTSANETACYHPSILLAGLDEWFSQAAEPNLTVYGIQIRFAQGMSAPSSVKPLWVYLRSQRIFDRQEAKSVATVLDHRTLALPRRFSRGSRVPIRLALRRAAGGIDQAWSARNPHGAGWSETWCV